MASSERSAEAAATLAYRTVISPNDRCGLRGVEYFESGLAALGCVRRALDAAGAGGPAAVLDLQCGHGQVTRMLRAAFPAAHLTACDRDPDAVDFCTAEFDAEPLYAPEDLAFVTPSRTYDLIWCGTVFAGMARSRWTGLLDRLTSALEPNGVIVMAGSLHAGQDVQVRPGRLV